MLVTRGMDQDAKNLKNVIENAKLCADRGWKASFHMMSGDVVEKAYITGTNWEQNVVSVEKVGERHLEPKIIYLKDVQSIEIGWS